MSPYLQRRPSGKAMKILFVSAWFPYPLDNGARIRVYNLIRALSREHEVSLVSLLQEDSRPADAERLADVCDVISLHESRWFKPGTASSMLGFFSARPRSALDTFDPRVRDAVRDAIDRISPDAVVMSTLGVVEYLPRELRTPCVLDEHNCEYAVLKRNAEKMQNIIKRLRYSLAWRKFAKWEARVCRRFDSVVMVSESDRALILAAAPNLREVGVVPNGVDVSHYSPVEWQPNTTKLLYNGALTYRANEDAVRHFASDIYPLLRERCPEVVLHVTGRTTDVDVRGIVDCPGIELTGYVEDIRDELRNSAVCVVPLREGGGSRLKILEAMAAGVPVVSTSIGVEGIDAVAGTHLLVADTPADFAEAVGQVLEDAHLSRALSANARAFVEEQYSWSNLGREFSRIVESVAGKRSDQRIFR